MRTKPASLALTIAALTLGSTLLSGCGLFTPAETLNMTAGDSGMDARVGDYLAQNVILVENEAGIVSLSATIINDSDATDNITAVTFNGNQATLTPADQTLTARGIVRFGYNSTSYADLAGSSIKAGDHVKVKFVFASGKTLSVMALVFSSADPLYSNVTPAPAAK